MPLSAVFHTSSLQAQMAALSDAFAIEGEFLHCDPINSGHINMTFRAAYRKPNGTTSRCIFQRVNDAVFPCPRDVMHNVEKVTNHIRWKMLRVLKTPFRQPALTACRKPRRKTPADGLRVCRKELDFITPQEVSRLAFSGLLITLETGIRFLTDYLEGDVYFKTEKENHNLLRTRTQLRLVESMEEQMPEMEECVRKSFQAVNG